MREPGDEGSEVAVDDAREEEKRRAQLLDKPPSEVERDAAEVGVAEEFVEMVGEELKDETEVVLE